MNSSQAPAQRDGSRQLGIIEGKHERSFLGSEPVQLARYFFLLFILLGLTILGDGLVDASNTSDDTDANTFGRLVIDEESGDVDLSSVRFGAAFNLAPLISSQVELGLIQSDVQFQNLNLTLGKANTITMGKKKLVRGFSTATSSLFSSFVSRPTIISLTGGLEREFGIEGTVRKGRLLVQPALFVSEDWSRTSKIIRAIFQGPEESNYFAHFGVSAVARSGGRQMNFASSSETLMGEWVWGSKNWYVASEAIWHNDGVSEVLGAYADIGVIFGGELTYDRSRGILKHRRVNSAFSNGGRGAIEIAFRQEAIQEKTPVAENATSLLSELSLIWYPSAMTRLIVGRRFSFKNRSSPLFNGAETSVRLQLIY
ncbi:MAG: hypothetical protein JJ850_11485 [Kordiimonadaceae bacterium]|nr:hypothetical protein [Kordiimonadaceae bacterium]MBO6568791.1 hypothetical protein [Kordiimonadaceae bacterium]MBO6965234.1 hypothetical protein [Kordiimonadaceae bacterium]